MVREEGWAGGESGGVVGSALTRAPRLLRGKGRLEGLVEIPLPDSRKERRGRLLEGCHAARRSKRGKGTMERLWKLAPSISCSTKEKTYGRCLRLDTRLTWLFIAA